MFLCVPYNLINCSYIKHLLYIVQNGSSYLTYFGVEADVPQGSDISADLFNVYTADILTTTNIIITTYEDSTVIICTSRIIQNLLQIRLNIIDN